MFSLLLNLNNTTLISTNSTKNKKAKTLYKKFKNKPCKFLKKEFVNLIQHDLIKSLKDFKVSGTAVAVDPNHALIFDTQNPSLTYALKMNREK